MGRIGGIVGSTGGIVGSGKFVGTDEGIVMTVGRGSVGNGVLSGLIVGIVTSVAVGVGSTRGVAVAIGVSAVGVVIAVPVLVNTTLPVLVSTAVTVPVNVCGSSVGVGVRDGACIVIVGTGEERSDCSVAMRSCTVYVAGTLAMISVRMVSLMGGII